MEILTPLGVGPGPTRDHGVYDGMSHRDQFNLLVNLIAIEKSNYPQAIAALEWCLFELAVRQGYPTILLAISVPLFPAPQSSGPHLGWMPLVKGDGQVWYAYL